MASLAGIKKFVSQTVTSVSDNFSYTTESVHGALYSRIFTPIKNVRDNIEVSTKIVQVALSTLALYNWKTGKEVLGKLSPSLLNAVDMTFFLHLATQFKGFLLPVSATTIDTEASLKILTTKLKEQLQGKPVYSNSLNDDIAIEYLAKKLLHDQLDRMYKGNEALPKGGAFGEALTNRIQNTWKHVTLSSTFESNGRIKPNAIVSNSISQLNSFDLSNFDVSKIEFPTVRNSLLQRIINVVWFIVDIGTTTMFLKFWNVVDTAKLALSVGKVKVFGKEPFYGLVNLQPLEVWVRGAVVTGFALNLIEAAFRLSKYSSLSESGKAKLKLDLAANATDIIYHGASLVNESGFRTISAGALNVLSIFARSVGIYCALNQPGPKYKELLAVNSAVKI